MFSALLLLAAVTLAVPDGADAVAPPDVAADSARLDSLATDLAARIRCPVCRQLSVEDSPSELARELKSVVRDRLARGESEEEVMQYFVSKYGEWVLLEPPKKGFNLVVWWLPVLGLLGGGIVLGVAFRSWLPGGGSGEAERPARTPPDLEGLRDESDQPDRGVRPMTTAAEESR